MSTAQTATIGEAQDDNLMVVSNVQTIIPYASILKDNDLQSSESCVQILHYLPMIIIVYSSREEAQEEHHLPNLPTEIILQILSYSHSRSTQAVNTEIPKAISVTAHGLLPFLILNPSLLFPPYCNYFGPRPTQDYFTTSLTMKTIKTMDMEIHILTVVGISSHIDLDVCIKHWQAVRDNRDSLFLLLQHSRRWKRLVLHFEILGHISQMLDTLSTCLPSLAELKLQCAESGRVFTEPASSMAMDSSKQISFPLYALPTLFDTGILDFVTKLDNSRFQESDTGTLRSAMKSLPRILSSLPCLQVLSLFICSVTYYEEYNSERVQSDSLRILSLCRIKRGQEPFLALFSDCQIDTIYQPEWPVSLERLGLFFPGVKELSCVRLC